MEILLTYLITGNVNDTLKHNLSELNALRGFRTGGERQRSADRFAKGAKLKFDFLTF